MFQCLLAPQGRLLHDLQFILGQHIKKDGAISSVLFRVLVTRWRTRMATSGISFSLAVFIYRLTSPLLGQQGFIPLARVLPIPQGLVCNIQLLGQLPQAYFFTLGFPGDIFSLGGVALLAPLRHFAPPNTHCPATRQGNRKAHSGISPPWASFPHYDLST